MPAVSPKHSILPKVAVFVLASGISAAFFINWCDFVYQCGCRSLWNGAAESCNIHIPNVPHCPWCVRGGLGGFLSFGAIVVSQALLSFWPGGPPFGTRLVGALLAFPAIGGISALICGWLTGYWSA